MRVKHTLKKNKCEECYKKVEVLEHMESHRERHMNKSRLNIVHKYGQTNGQAVTALQSG